MLGYKYLLKLRRTVPPCGGGSTSHAQLQGEGAGGKKSKIKFRESTNGVRTDRKRENCSGCRRQAAFNDKTKGKEGGRGKSLRRILREKKGDAERDGFR